jgi:hypothetical protein
VDFSIPALRGFERSLGFVVAAVVGHGVFDFVHHWLVDNPRVYRVGGLVSI